MIYFTSKHTILFSAIEFVIFAVGFIPFTVEFIAFAIEFSPFAIESVGFAGKFVVHAQKIVTVTLEHLYFSKITEQLLHLVFVFPAASNIVIDE